MFLSPFILRRFVDLLSFFLVCFFIVQCQTTRSGRSEYIVQVKKGDTLAGIAHRFDTTPTALAKLNGLTPPIQLNVGDSLRVIPGPSGMMAGESPIQRPGQKPGLERGISRGSSRQIANPEEFTDADFPDLKAGEGKTQGKLPAEKLRTQKKGLFFGGSVEPRQESQLQVDPLIDRDFLEESAPIRDELLALEPLRWPLRGSITSHFGDRRGHFHKGVDIKASHGAPIFPSAEGKVLFAGKKKSYGKVVILQHRFHQTLYAHLSAIRVQKGEWVDLRRVIGLVGATGNARGTHLHFEVIDASLTPVDPVAVMTKSHSFRIAKISGDKDFRNRGVTRIQ